MSHTHTRILAVLKMASRDSQSGREEDSHSDEEVEEEEEEEEEEEDEEDEGVRSEIRHGYRALLDRVSKEEEEDHEDHQAKDNMLQAMKKVRD